MHRRVWSAGLDLAPALQHLARTRGSIAALASSHAFAYLEKMRDRLIPETIVVINLSGRGEKDMDTVVRSLELG